MAAAVVTGIILALFAVMFNFSIHKIDEGKKKYLETLLVAAVMFQFAFNFIVLHIAVISFIFLEDSKKRSNGKASRKMINI